MKVNSPEEFKAPIISWDEIRKKADDFRQDYWSSNKVPVDILLIVENKLNLNIVPVKNFKSQNDIEALLYDNGKSLAVDETEYMDDRFLNRIRFSVAHEIAHLILHKELYEAFYFETIDDWINAIQLIPDVEYNWIENQANEFAGRLLVPSDLLLNEISSLNEKIYNYKKRFPDSENNLLVKHIATLICKKFGVSDSVISKRITKEKLII